MRIIIILLFVFLINVSRAQLINNYGLKIGITNSFEKWNYKSEFPNDFETGTKTGLNVSAFAQISDLPLFAEIGYNQKGMHQRLEKTSVSDPEGTGEFINLYNRVDYLDFSLTARMSYAMPVVTPYLFAGPGMSVLIGKDISPGYDVIYNDYENVVYGLKLGIGSEIRNVLPVTFLVEARYNYDLSNSFKSELLKINNSSYELKVGIVL